jgi:hypothetical protein
MFKKRPTTANRLRNNAVPFGYNHKQQRNAGNQGGPVAFNSKNPSTLDLEVSRMRPRNIK